MFCSAFNNPFEDLHQRENGLSQSVQYNALSIGDQNYAIKMLLFVPYFLSVVRVNPVKCFDSIEGYDSSINHKRRPGQENLSISFCEYAHHRLVETIAKRTRHKSEPASREMRRVFLFIFSLVASFKGYDSED